MKKFFRVLLLTFLTTSLVAHSATQTAEDFFLKGNEQFDQKKYDDAIVSFSECINLSPQSADCFYNRAIVYSTKASRESNTSASTIDGVNINHPTRLKALADVNKVIELRPQKAMGFYLRGTLYSAEVIFDKALADFKKSLSLEPNMATTNKTMFEAVTKGLTKAEYGVPRMDIFKGRKLALRAQYELKPDDKAGAKKLYEKAIEYFTAAIAIGIDGVSTEAFDERARMYRNLERYNESVEDYTRSINISKAKKTEKNFLSSYAYSLNSRANIYKLQNKTALALADYASVLLLPVSEETKYPIQDALISRGKLLLDLSRADEAISDFDKILAASPKYGQVWYYRGLAQIKKNDKPKAIADLTKAVELDSKNRDAIAELAKLGVIFTIIPPPNTPKLQ